MRINIGENENDASASFQLKCTNIAADKTNDIIFTANSMLFPVMNDLTL